jgi:hypothetical protein
MPCINDPPVNIYGAKLVLFADHKNMVVLDKDESALQHNIKRL